MTNKGQPDSSFEDFKFDFEWDTKLKANDNLALYIEYYKAKLLEQRLSTIEITLSGINIYLQQIHTQLKGKK